MKRLFTLLTFIVALGIINAKRPIVSAPMHLKVSM